jgi:hypothetical protein
LDPVVNKPAITALAIIAPATISPGVGGLLLLNMTLEPNSQIITRVTAPGLLTYSDLLVLVSGLP